MVTTEIYVKAEDSEEVEYENQSISQVFIKGETAEEKESKCQSQGQDAR
jgi:archaellum component FlaG (FlaF/FlaG flagellin family)